MNTPWYYKNKKQNLFIKVCLCYACLLDASYRRVEKHTLKGNLLVMAEK
jgi:hypothetical protein